MAIQLCLAESRDDLRRKLQIIPPFDWPQGSPQRGPAGKQPDYAPVPSNQVINMAIRDALAKVNVYSGFHSNIIEIEVDPVPVTTIGPYKIKLESFSVSPITDPTETTNLSDIFEVLGANNINGVRSATWTDGLAGSVPLPLYPAPRRITNREDIQVETFGAAVPQNYYMDGLFFWMYPAPVNGGTLELWIDTGLRTPAYDTDIIDQLPADYQTGIRFISLVMMAKYLTMNVEMQQRALNFTNDALWWEERIASWYNRGNSQQEQSSVGMVTGRDFYGGRRRRR